MASKTGLQIRMTVFVTSVVLLVSAVALLIIGRKTSGDIEEYLDEKLNIALASISGNIEQRLLGIEDVTKVLANNIGAFAPDERKVDILLSNSIKELDGVLGVAIVLDEGIVPSVKKGYYQRFVTYSPDSAIVLGTYINSKEQIMEDPGWKQCFINGEQLWSEPMDGPFSSDIVYYYAIPIYTPAGKRIGVVYTDVLQNFLTEFVVRHKAHKNIDISIYNDNGKTIVAPDDYILKVKPEDLMLKKSRINNTGWDVSLMADRKLIDEEVRRELTILSLIIFVMYVVICLSIMFTVRFVARPFDQKQQRIEKEKAVMDNELKLAANAQRELLPHACHPFPERKGIDIAACLYPARDVGGDIYDYFIRDNKLYFCIGDVSGKGLQASLFMSATHYLFRSVTVGAGSDEAVRRMNVSLCTDNEQCRFVTFWFGCLDLGNGELEFVNAGHDAPVLVRDGRTKLFPISKNLPLGIDKDEQFVSDSFQLQSGDLLLLYTDGITEAMDSDLNRFGRDRMIATVAVYTAVHAEKSDASSIVDCVRTSVSKHAGGAAQSDDITMLCLRFLKNEIQN